MSKAIRYNLLLAMVPLLLTEGLMIYAVYMNNFPLWHLLIPISLGRVDKAQKGDSRDAAGHDSTLIFMQEISVDPRASDGRAVGVLRTFCH